jgi:HD-GYP domain-containing protein (c-di-GMP phosphodiesterase class II)
LKSTPHNSNDPDIIKLGVGDLRSGMFVSMLDRPWSETPFLFEGFEIQTDADIEVIRKYCEFVYVDLSRTHVVRVKIEDGPLNSFAIDRQISLEAEIHSAEQTKQETSNLVKSFMDELRFGKSVDVQLAKSAVSNCVASIMRNPDAMMFMMQMQEKTPFTSEHAFNVCVYSIILGRMIGLEEKKLEDIGTCGLLHNIGNIEIPEEILLKKEPLTEEEFEIIKQHTVYGRDILMSGRNIYAGAVDVAYAHHELLDGSGYPRGLSDTQIHRYCRIVAIVDKYEAISKSSVYKPAKNHLEAVNILNALADSNKIDKKLTTSFIDYLGFYPPGTIVQLTSGEIAVVVKSDAANRLRPQVLVVRNVDGNPVEVALDLAKNPLDGRGKGYKIKMVHTHGHLGIDLSKYQEALINAYD